MTLSRRGLLAAGGAMGALATTAAGPGTAVAAGHGAGRNRVRTGFDRLAADGYRLLAGEKVGIVTNPTGITGDVRHIVDVMHPDDRVNLTASSAPNTASGAPRRRAVRRAGTTTRRPGCRSTTRI